MTEDIQFMRRVLDLARKGYGRVSPNPMVGALVVKDGVVIGEGYHQGPGKPHAEVLALEEAGAQAAGATLYVNLEPCSHFGRTPPCVDKVISAGITKVVCSMEDPNSLVAGRGFKKLAASGVEVVPSFLGREARRLNESYIKFITAGLPFVTCKYAMTLDGKISTSSGQSQWISGEESHSQVHFLRKGSDGILTGVGTVISDNPRLTCRLPEKIERQPARIVVDTNLRIPLHSRVLTEDSSRTIIATTEKSCPIQRERIKETGSEVLVVSTDSEGRVDLKELIGRLGKQGISSLLVEGGPGLITSMFEAGLIDKFVVFVAPKIIGGNEAPAPVGGVGVERIGEAVVLEEVEIRKMGRDVMITGYVNKQA